MRNFAHKDLLTMKELTPITMKDIAKALNVSVATVSRALKDSQRISQAQRDKIKEYAREHNYSPNFIAESLRNSKRKAQGAQFPGLFYSVIRSLRTPGQSRPALPEA